MIQVCTEPPQALLAATTLVLVLATLAMSFWLFIGAWLVQAV
jgi:hypothetical protein